MYKYGDLCKHYSIVKLVGEGNYGKIYMVQNIESGQMYAVKKISLNNKCGIDSISLHEIINLTNLNHPNIIKIHDLIIDTHEINIVMDYISYNLAEYVLTHSLSIDNANYIFIQIADALLYMHNNGIVHGDLSSRNIMIDENLRIYLIDFGFSRKLRRKIDIKPTIDARPYELFDNNNNNVDISKIDIWALGCIYYFLLVRDVIIDAENDNSYEWSIEKVLTSGSLFHMSKLKYAMIDEDYINIIMKMLDKDSNLRYNITQLFNNPLVMHIKDKFLIVPCNDTNNEINNEAKIVSVMCSDKRIYVIECIMDLKRIYNSNNEIVFNSLYMIDALYNKLFTTIPLENMCFIAFVLSYKVVYGIDIDLIIMSSIFEHVIGKKITPNVLIQNIIEASKTLNWNIEYVNIYDFLEETKIDDKLSFYLINSFIISELASIDELTKICAINLVIKCSEGYSQDDITKTIFSMYNRKYSTTKLAKTIKKILRVYFIPCIIDDKIKYNTNIQDYVKYSHDKNSISAEPIFKINCNYLLNNFIQVL